MWRDRSGTPAPPWFQHLEVPMIRPVPPRRYSPLWLVAAAVTLAVASGVVSQPPADKSPVPDSAAQARAEALVKKLYANEYAEAKKAPAAALALASSLL